MKLFNVAQAHFDLFTYFEAGPNFFKSLCNLQTETVAEIFSWHISFIDMHSVKSLLIYVFQFVKGPEVKNPKKNSEFWHFTQSVKMWKVFGLLYFTGTGDI